MSINLSTSCKKIIFSSFKNETKSFDLKENLRIAPGKNIYFKDNLIPLSQNVSFTKFQKIITSPLTKLLLVTIQLLELMKYLISKKGFR